MVVRLRLARLGRKKWPFFKIHAVDARKPRDTGKPLDDLGSIDPIPGNDGNKHVMLDIDRVKYWLSVGAQPTPPVSRLLSQLGILPHKPHGERPLKPVRNPDKHRDS